jgi:hypothetical protein
LEEPGVTEERESRPARFLAALSILPTAWLLFITSSHDVYVRNQDELARQVGVLFPFWTAFLATLVLGVLLFAYRRFLPVRYGLWAYYLAGFVFLAFSFLRGLSVGAHFFLGFFDTVLGVSVLSSVFGLALLFLGRRSPGALAVPLGAFGLLIAASDVVRLAPKIAGSAEAAVAPSVEVDPGGRASGNVYHVIFDALEAELFEASLAGRDRGALQGSVVFPRTRSLALATRESLAHIFTGRRLPGRPEERLLRAFNDATVSFLEPLRREGMRTVAFVPRSVYPAEIGFMDVVRFHDENVRTDDLREINRVTMLRLWLFSSFPLPVAAAPWRRPDAFEAFDGEALRRLDNQRLLSYSAPIGSYLSFQRFLELEGTLPGEGRYTLVHVLIPHAPMVMGPECAYDPYGTRTTPVDQFGCASRMLLDLVGTLQRLGRYDSSLIVVHGDHGLSLRLEGGRLVADDGPRLNPWLMVKAPGAQSPPRISTREATLLDIAPTILDWLGRDADPAVEGRSLLREPAG